MNSSHCHLVVGQIRDERQGNAETPKTRHKKLSLYHSDDGDQAIQLCIERYQQRQVARGVQVELKHFYT